MQNYTHADLLATLQKLDDVKLDHRYGKELDVYTYDDEPFLVYFQGSSPLKVTLRCDHQLAKSLQRQYESVLSSDKLDPKKWVTILATEQLPDGFMHDLCVHAYIQVGGEL